MTVYHALHERFEYSADPIKGSRFLAVLVPCRSEGEALAALAEVQKQHKDASHHCWAYRLVDGSHRSHDDGEPRGSAGRPILAQLEGHDAADLIAVVARWFGGTKLGVGGLIRAYGGTAGKALDRASMEEVQATTDLVLSHGYEDTNAVAAVLAAIPHTVVENRFEADVTLVLRLADSLVEEAVSALRERTGGRVKTEIAG